MAWSSAVSYRKNVGSLRFVSGTYTDAQTTGTQDVVTGLKRIMAHGTTNQTGGRAQKTTLSGGTISFTAATNDDDGTWWAVGV